MVRARGRFARCAASPREGEWALPTWCTADGSINPTPGTRTQGIPVTGLEVRHESEAMSACVPTDGRQRMAEVPGCVARVHVSKARVCTGCCAQMYTGWHTCATYKAPSSVH